MKKKKHLGYSYTITYSNYNQSKYCKIAKYLPTAIFYFIIYSLTYDLADLHKRGRVWQN